MKTIAYDKLTKFVLFKLIDLRNYVSFHMWICFFGIIFLSLLYSCSFIVLQTYTLTRTIICGGQRIDLITWEVMIVFACLFWLLFPFAICQLPICHICFLFIELRSRFFFLKYFIAFTSVFRILVIRWLILNIHL